MFEHCGRENERKKRGGRPSVSPHQLADVSAGVHVQVVRGAPESSQPSLISLPINRLHLIPLYMEHLRQKTIRIANRQATAREKPTRLTYNNLSSQVALMSRRPRGSERRFILLNDSLLRSDRRNQKRFVVGCPGIFGSGSVFRRLRYT